MVSKAKLYSKLDRMEEELRERIVPHLKEASKGKNDLVFCASGFSSFPELKLKPDIETDALIQLGRQILVLKEKLGESSNGSVAERICWYCRKWGDSGGNYRKAAQTLAAEWLQEIEGTDSKAE